MRKIVVIFFGIISIMTSNCGNISNKDIDRSVLQQYDTGSVIIIFKEYEHDFGKVIFDTSGRNGRQTKTIKLKSNASTPVVLLRIVAEVVTNNN